MKDFKDKVAVITGAGSGIGRALALQLAAAGARLALNDWNPSSLKTTLEQIKGETVCFDKVYDVADPEATRTFAQQVIDRFQQVDLVINNAGIALPQRTVEQTSIEDFTKVLQVNLWGVIYGSKVFLPYLLQRPEAVLVNISSIFGIVGQPLQAPYVTAKFAVRGFTETLRNELKDSSVNVICVHPGGIRTNIIRNIDTTQTRYRDKFAGAFEKMAKTTPETAATVILGGIQKKRKRILIGSDARQMDWLARLLPQRYGKVIYKKVDLDKFSAPPEY